MQTRTLPLLAALLTLLAACEEKQVNQGPAGTNSADLVRQVDLPNVILIVADDLGWLDLGSYGNDFIETPHLDRLAAEGLRFQESYASGAICSPSRVAIQTGLTPARLGITEHFHGPNTPKPWQKVIPPDNEPNLAARYNTVAEEMRRAGYARRLHIGKWHAGGNGPIVHGYSGVYGDNGGYQLNSSYHYPFWPGINPQSNNPYAEIIRDAKSGDYLTDVLTDRALREITEANAQKSAFFLHIDYFAPHVPIDGKADLTAKYTAKKATYAGAIDMDPEYAAMVETIDANVGRIVDSLRALGIADNTLLLFTSDNGGLAAREQPPFDPHTPATNNGLLREGKGHVYEGGIRVPMIVWGKDVPGGRVSETPHVGHDIFPTLDDYVTGKVLEDIDGVSHAAEYRGGPTAYTDRLIYWHYPHYSNQGGYPKSTLRKGNYKALYDWGDSTVQLYNLRGDLGETMDLYGCGQWVADSLNTALMQELKTARAKLPVRNPGYRP